MAGRAHAPALSESEQLKEYARQKGVDLARLPRHIAMIMDGNGRWAQKRGLPRLLGHRQGYKTLRKVVKECGDLGIEAISLYAFSAENWRRPQDETTGLMRLIEQAAIDELRMLQQNGVRFRVSGRIHELPRTLQEALLNGCETTRENTGLIMNLCVNYGGRAELVDAMKAIARKAAAGELNPDEIDETTIGNHLYAADLPDPDLLIRTAGEMRVSNFLLWEIAYSELYVTDALWPEFNIDILLSAITAYQKRVRKFGGVVDPK